MKNLLKVALVAFCMVLMGNFAKAQTQKIGYIAVDQLIPLLPEYKTAETALNVASQGWQDVINKLGTEAQDKNKAYEDAVAASFKSVQEKYPGIELKKNAAGWEISIPAKYDTGHESHFAQVANKYMEYLKAGKLPEWEVPNMIAKYFTTTSALTQAKKK